MPEGGGLPATRFVVFFQTVSAFADTCAFSTGAAYCTLLSWYLFAAAVEAVGGPHPAPTDILLPFSCLLGALAAVFVPLVAACLVLLRYRRRSDATVPRAFADAKPLFFAGLVLGTLLFCGMIGLLLLTVDNDSWYVFSLLVLPFQGTVALAVVLIALQEVVTARRARVSPGTPWQVLRAVAVAASIAIPAWLAAGSYESSAPLGVALYLLVEALGLSLGVAVALVVASGSARVPLVS